MGPQHVPRTKTLHLHQNYLQKGEQPIWTFWKPLIPYKLVRVCENLLENNYYTHTPLRRGEKVFLWV